MGSDRQAGVALALDKRTHAPCCRGIIARFSHTFGILAVFVAYAPTNTSPDSDKHGFHAMLEHNIRQLKQSDVVLGLGDFNAETGTSRVNLERVLGPHGSGTHNDNSERLMNFCSDLNLCIAGSWFQRRNVQRRIWLSNDGIKPTVKEIDHVLVSTRWTILENCRVFRSLEFPTDHCPVIASLALKMRRSNNNTRSQNLCYNLRKLNDPEIESQYSLRPPAPLSPILLSTAKSPQSLRSPSPELSPS